MVLDPQKAGLTLQYHHVRTLEEDEDFRAKLRNKAKVLGELVWKILEPLITLGMSNPAPSVLKDCRTFCLNIAEVAYMLNAGVRPLVIGINTLAIIAPISVARPTTKIDITSVQFQGRLLIAPYSAGQFVWG